MNFKAEDLYIGNNVNIKHPNSIMIGKHVAIDDGVYMTTSAQIGDYVHIAPYSVIIGGIESNLVMMHFSGLAARTTVIVGSDDFTLGMMNPQVPIKYRRPKITTVTLEPFACTGVHCVIMPGVTMAIGSVLGANSVLTKDTEPWTIYVGSPAKPIKIRDKDLILKYAKELGYEF